MVSREVDLFWSPDGGPAPDPLLAFIHESNRRKRIAREQLNMVGARFGPHADAAVFDAFHGETHLGIDPHAEAALAHAFSESLTGRADMREPSGDPYDKCQPACLREMAARLLFARMRDPGDALEPLCVSPDQVVVCPYSSTCLLEEALATCARPAGVVLCPEGFYKNAALHVAKYGMRIVTVPVNWDSGFKVRLEALERALRALTRQGRLACLLMTQPGNPIMSEYSAAELAALGAIIAKAGVRVICDAAFDQLADEYAPLANVRVGTRRLFDQVLTITGNSKGHGASGPFKFGAACTGDDVWRAELRGRMTVAFQRETTHLARALLELTTPAFLANNRVLLSRQQSRARTLLDHINRRHGDVLRVYDPAPQGMFLSIGFSPFLRERVQVRSSLELEDLLLLGAGIDSVCFERMGSRLVAVRLNVAAPRRNGRKDPDLLDELFARIEELVCQIEAGLRYPDLVCARGLLPLCARASSA
jgi:aspartate/methionine/tyrosine aminotransferase